MFCYRSLVKVDEYLMISDLAFIVSLESFILLSKLGDLVSNRLMHLIRALLDVRIHLSQAQSRLIYGHILVFIQLDAIIYSRLVHQGKHHVSDLLHCEHSRLLEAVRFEIVQVCRL